MYTEDEARNKFCPSNASNHIYCVAKNCMEWRIQEHLDPPTHSKGMTYYETRHTGYCGIAGKT